MSWKNWLTRPILVAAFALSLTSAAGDVKGDGDTLGGDFTLTSADGPVQLGDLRGSVILVFFGYTSCPDVCPLSLARISACLSSLEPQQARRVKGLFITLDPGRDTPQRMREYAGFFHPDIIGLSGQPEEIEQVAHQYGIEYERRLEPDSALGYTISHPTAIQLIDESGSLAGEVLDDEGMQALRTRVLALLGEGS